MPFPAILVRRNRPEQYDEQIADQFRFPQKECYDAGRAAASPPISPSETEGASAEQIRDDSRRLVSW